MFDNKILIDPSPTESASPDDGSRPRFCGLVAPSGRVALREPATSPLGANLSLSISLQNDCPRCNDNIQLLYYTKFSLF